MQRHSILYLFRMVDFVTIDFKQINFEFSINHARLNINFDSAAKSNVDQV